MHALQKFLLFSRNQMRFQIAVSQLLLQITTRVPQTVMMDNWALAKVSSCNALHRASPASLQVVEKFFG